MTQSSSALGREISLRGLTLQERLRLAAALPQRGQIENRLGPERLEIWKSWFNRGPAGARGWDNFLAENKLTERKLIRLESFADPKNKRPAWTKTLQCIYDYLDRFDIKPNAKFNLAENLAGAVAAFAMEQVSASRNWRLLSTRAQFSFEQSLIHRLARTARQTINWELSAAGADRQLSQRLQRDGISLHKCFLASGVNSQALRLLENYPALSRLWTVQIEFWIRFVEDFLEHARSLRARARTDKAPIISWVDVDLSDPHEGNRAVIRVRFRDGGEWFYKPRSGQQERAWFNLLRWFNDNGFPLGFQVLEIRCEDRHSWMEAVRSRNCRNKKDVTDCCVRFGALICLIHVLRGVDFHPANIIFCGDQPVVVDCETLLHPATRLPAYARAEEESIVRTGVLAPVNQISGMATKLSCRREQVLESLSNGFRVMHDFLRTDRDGVSHLKKWTGSLGKISSRKIYRPTAHYCQMLEQSLAPSLLASGLERSLFLHAFCRDTIQTSRRVNVEVKALENADIPLFRGKPGVLHFDLSKKTFDESISMMRCALESHHKTQVHR